MARCSDVKIDPNYSSESVYSLNQIEQFHDTIKNALKELPLWINTTDINNALFALTSQAEVAVEYEFSKHSPQTEMCHGNTNTDGTEEFLNNGTYMLDTVINGDAIESENKIINIIGRNYNIIE